MAGQGADPAALLTVYLRHDRLADAADLVLNHLATYQKVLSAPYVSMKLDLETPACHYDVLLMTVSAGCVWQCMLTESTCLQASIITKEGHCCVWFPFQIITKLMARLQRDVRFSSRHVQLQEALQKHLQSCAEVSSNFLEKLNQETIDGMEE